MVNIKVDRSYAVRVRMVSMDAWNDADLFLDKIHSMLLDRENGV